MALLAIISLLVVLIGGLCYCFSSGGKKTRLTAVGIGIAIFALLAYFPDPFLLFMITVVGGLWIGLPCIAGGLIALLTAKLLGRSLRIPFIVAKITNGIFLHKPKKTLFLTVVTASRSVPGIIFLFLILMDIHVR